MYTGVECCCTLEKALYTDVEQAFYSCINTILQILIHDSFMSGSGSL